MTLAPKWVNCISVIYSTFLYTYMPHTDMVQLNEILRSQLLMGPNQIHPIFWINILQDLQGQEAASRISVGTCCQSWLRGRCGSLGDYTYFLLTWKYYS